MDGEAAARVRIPEAQKLYMESTLLRIAGALFCHDPKTAGKRTDTIELNRSVTDKHIIIRPDPRLGQPRPLAHKVFVALLKKHSDYGKPVRKEISFTRREIGRLIGRKEWGGRDSEQLIRALHEIHYTFITTHFKKSGGRYQEHSFNIFPEILIERREFASDPIEACTITVAEPIISSLQDEHFTCLNFALMQELGTIGQALYMRAFFHFANLYNGTNRSRLSFQKRYEDICPEWLGGLTVVRHKSKIIDRLGPHLDQLVAANFLASYPHGDLAESIIDCVPRGRTNDVCYLNVGDTAQPVGFNPLASVAIGRRALAASGIVSAFKHLWSDSWGPRTEHLLYHGVRALLDVPGTTLIDLPRLYTDADFRRRVVQANTDPVTRRFWDEEFGKYAPQYRLEVTAPLRSALTDYFILAWNPSVLGYAISGGFFYGGAFAYIAGTPFAYIDYYHVTPQTYGLLFGTGIVGIMLTNLLNARLVTRVGSDRFLQLGTAGAALAGVAAALNARFGWGGLIGLAGPLFIYITMAGLIVANSVAGALAAFPHRAGAMSALVGAMHYGAGVLSAAMPGWFADGTPWPMGWIIAACGFGSFVATILPVRPQRPDPGGEPTLAT